MALPLANPLIDQEYNSRRATTLARSVWRPLRLWHLASFDAPTVALVWALAFAWLAGAHLEPWVLALLASGTWTVYVADRLLDAYRAIHSGRLSALRERHFFHWRHRRALIPLASCSAALAAALIAHRMPIAVRERNSVLAAAALIYFSGVHSAVKVPTRLRQIVSKEMLVGLLFTAGCAVPTISRMRFTGGSFISVAWPLLVCCAYFAALAWANCGAIESWESPVANAGVLLRTGLLTGAGVATSTVLSFRHSRAAALVIAGTVSSLLLSLLDRARWRISPLALRVLADAVLLTPALLLAFGAHLL